MLYFLYGKDTFRSKRNARAITESLRERDPEAGLFRLDSENAEENKLKQLLSDSDLFGRKFVVVLDGLLSGEFGHLLVLSASQMAGSKNVYVILEEKPEAALAKKISKSAQKSTEFAFLPAKKLKEWILAEARERSLVLTPAETDFLIYSFGSNLWAVDRALEIKKLGGSFEINNFLYQPFGIVDLFARKKRREAHILFHKNLTEGVSSEEMFWKLWWQAKTLLAVSAYKEAGLDPRQIGQKTGLKRFTIDKCFQALSLFSREELEILWDNLFVAWSDSRLGRTELELKLEELLLTPS